MGILPMPHDPQNIGSDEPGFSLTSTITSTHRLRSGQASTNPYGGKGDFIKTRY
jgi:hypothetical protein